MTDMNQPTNEARGFFDLGESEGVNESERILTRLARRSFLRLWYQANIYTDKGFKNGKGPTKELCDGLMVFGNDVVIFSDKHIIFQNDNQLKLAWQRWYKRAIFESCGQLQKAKCWLERYPERAFLDPKCLRKLPVQIPVKKPVRFHLVAVTRGSRDATLIVNCGKGFGSLGISSGIEGNAHLDTPFTIGYPEPDKQFVHVFDETTIELLMSELDTAIDFIDYLKSREDLLGQREMDVIASGEEDLLAAYLRTMDESGTRNVFLHSSQMNPAPDIIVFDDTRFKNLCNDAAYRRKKQADEISYLWDALIERLVENANPTVRSFFADRTTQDVESILRLMAAESRFRRRQLAGSLLGALHKVEPGQQLSRISFDENATQTVFVFFVVPRATSQSFQEYWEYRIATLHALVLTAKLIAKQGTTFVGISFDNPHNDVRDGAFEQVVAISQNSWTDEELLKLESMRKEIGLWSPSMAGWRSIHEIFPKAENTLDLKPIELADINATNMRAWKNFSIADDVDVDFLLERPEVIEDGRVVF